MSKLRIAIALTLIHVTPSLCMFGHLFTSARKQRPCIEPFMAGLSTHMTPEQELKLAQNYIQCFRALPKKSKAEQTVTQYWAESEQEQQPPHNTLPLVNTVHHILNDSEHSYRYVLPQITIMGFKGELCCGKHPKETANHPERGPHCVLNTPDPDRRIANTVAGARYYEHDRSSIIPVSPSLFSLMATVHHLQKTKGAPVDKKSGTFTLPTGQQALTNK